MSLKALLRVAGIAALPICATLVVVACSSGARYAPTPVGANAAGRAPDASLNAVINHRPAMQANLRGEVLTASSVTVKYVGKTGTHTETTFSASGVAKGPYPGTFVASGSWGRYVSAGGPYWYFIESLNISSKAHRHDIPRRILGNGGCSDLSCSGILTKTTFGPTSITVKLRLYRAGRFGHVEAPDHHAVKANLIKADSLKEWLQ